MARFSTSILFPLALLACSGEQVGNGEQKQQPEPTPPATEAGEAVSILRPDIDDPGVVPLVPEQLVLNFTEGATLSQGALDKLTSLLGTRALEEGGAITIGGHSDAGGNDAVNLRISQQRADAVKDWLVQHGVDPDRITTVAFGEQNPLAPNALPDGSPDEQGRATNRRAEVLIEVPASPAAPSGVKGKRL